MVNALIRVASYPVVAGGLGIALLVALTHDVPYWPTFPLLAALGLTAVAALERWQPYEPAWRHDHGDLRTDLAHAFVNLSLLLLTVEGLFAWRAHWAVGNGWPQTWPAAAQVLLAGTLIDLGLYAMHRASHHVGWLWALHTPHHSSERLYWLNGERRHPLHALLLAGPGLLAVVALGAPAAVVATWLTFLTIHLGFQHANLDYTLGPLNRWIGVASMHRWHHRRAYEDAQVNFGEFWLLWDRLFGTFHDAPGAVRAGDVGLHDRSYPTGYGAQLRAPFTQPRSPAPTVPGAVPQSTHCALTMRPSLTSDRQVPTVRNEE